MTGKTLKGAQEFFTSQDRLPVTLSIKYLIDHNFCSQFRNNETAINLIHTVHGQVCLLRNAFFNNIISKIYSLIFELDILSVKHMY